MWSAEFSESIFGRKRAPEVRHGSPLLVTPKTHCGHWICFDVNRQYYEPTGSWWSWINSRDGIVGFAVYRGFVDGVALCRMFNRAIHTQTLPQYLSSDHDPLYRFHQWQANLRVLEIQEIKTVPYVPLSHPFVERLIGTSGGNTWTKRYSGRQQIWRKNFESSSTTSMDIARTQAWKDGCPSLVEHRSH